MIERCKVPSGDNYSYVLYDRPGGTGCIVDPVAAQRVQEVLEEQSLDPVVLVNTHGHGDHTGSNSQFQSTVDEVICHPEEQSSVPGASRTIQDGETIPIGSLDIEVLHTPGHTPGSICLRTPDALITGDTVFLSGCGNTKFGGDTRSLFESFQDKIRPLSDDLELCPGHDYARRNLNFAKSIEPDNSAIDRKLDEFSDTDDPTSTLGEERDYNPFLRYDVPELIEQVDGVTASSSDWDVFQRLRDLRDQW